MMPICAHTLDAGVDVLRDVGRVNELSFAYREYEPWEHFVDAVVKQRVRKYCTDRAKHAGGGV